MQIADECVVHFHYKLTDDAGELIDASAEHQPLAYLHGAGNIVPGLEKAMQGRESGDSFEVKVAPEEGYGHRNDALVQTVPKEMFQGIDSIETGMRFTAESDRGPVAVTVTEVDGDQVTVDGNHALAGQNLNFAIEVTEVCEATAEELEHGHVHGPGGHEH